MKKHQISLCAILLVVLILTISPTALSHAGPNLQTGPDTPTATATQTVTDTSTATSTATAVATLAPTETSTPPAGARPVIVLSSYSTGDVLIGKEFTLNAQLKNTGQVDAYNMIITFTSDGFVPLGNGGVQSISKINVNGSSGISQKFVPAYSLSGSTSATMDLNINYTDIIGTPYSSTFTLLVNFKTYTSSGAISATRTPTSIPQPQLIIAFYETDLEKLQPGNSFKLTIHVQNMGNADAQNVTMVLGGATLSESGTPQPGGVSGGSADLANFAPLGTSNLYSLGKIATGQTIQQTIDLVVNVSTEPGAYPLNISFTYINPSGNASIDDQVITLLVYNLPNLTASYYQPVSDLYVGQPGILPIQITNVGKRSIVLSEMEIIPSSGSISNNKISVGTIDPGGYFTVDSEFIPDTSGEVNITLTISYTDDFTNPSSLTLTLPPLNVVEMNFLPEEGGMNGGGEFIPEQPAETPLTWWQILLAILRTDLWSVINYFLESILRTLDLFRLILDNLRRQRGRVALTALGVVIGTASIVMLVSLASGLQQSIINQFSSMGSLTTISVQMNYGSEMMGGGGGSGGSISSGSVPAQVKKITNATIREIEAIPNVSKVIIRLWAETGGPIRVGKLETYPGYMGLNINDLGILDIPMQEGTNVIKRGEAVIGADVLKNFYNPYGQPGDPPPDPPDLLNKRVPITLYKYSQDGEAITKIVDVKIVGIVKEMTEYSWAMVLPMSDIESWNEWNRGKRINRNQEGYPELIVKVDSMDSVLPVSDKIRDMGFMVYTQMEYVRQIQSTFTIMQIVFGGIGAIALFVAAIGIANTMTMAILERTHEIGLMKAVGATNRDVLAIFLGESASIGFVGGVLGSVLGWGMSKFFDQIMGQAMSGFIYLPPEAMQNAAQTPIWLIIFAIAFATLIGLLSGLYPSIRAAMMEPVVALKYE